MENRYVPKLFLKGLALVMNRGVFSCVLALAALLQAAAPAGAQTVVDQRVWATFTATGAIGTSHWKWNAESFFRTRNGVDELDTAAIRPSLSYAFDKHSTVGGGYALAPSFPAAGGVTVEHRIFEQYVWTGAAAGGTLSSRSRLEERFIEGNSGELTRFREQVRYAHPVAKGSKTSLVWYDEFFVHLNTTTRSPRGMDQNRAFAGVSQTFTKTARVEVGYLNDFVKGHNAADKMYHVLSVTLALTF